MSILAGAHTHTSTTYIHERYGRLTTIPSPTAGLGSLNARQGPL